MAKRIKLSRLFRTVVLLIISLVLGLSVYSWNAKSLVGNRLPMPFGYGLSVVLSGSMEPELSTDDLVLLKACADYQPGDVVVYQSGDVLVIHRLVEIGPDTAVTKGDANAVADEPIPAPAIKGKLIGKLPGAGRPVRWLKSPVGLVLLLAAAVALLELSWRGERKKDDEALDKIKEEIRKLKEEASRESVVAEDERKTQ